MSKNFRVRWSPEERSVIVSKMASLLNTGRKFSRSSLLLAAQEGLPYERRRNVFTNAESKGMFFKAEELAALRLKDPVAQPPKPEPVVEPEAESDLSKLLNALVDKIADKVAERLAAQLQVQVHTTTTTHSEHRPRHNPEPPCNAPRVVKTGVLILGMQPHQGNLLKQEFPMLDITCYDSDEARTKQVLLRAHTIGMTRFLSHQVEDRYRKCPRYHRHSAGTSELKTLLKQIAQGIV